MVDRVQLRVPESDGILPLSQLDLSLKALPPLKAVRVWDHVWPRIRRKYRVSQ